MEALVDKVQPVVQARGSVASRINFLMASCLMHLRKERYVISDEMMANQREAFSLSRGVDDLRTKVDIQFELGFLLLWRRELDEAEEFLKASLELSKIAEILPRQTLLLTYLTIVNRFKGQIEEVINYASLAEQAAINAHMPDYVAAAKGNQAWLAWRNQNISLTMQSGLEAFEIWKKSPLMYPFQWMALWPLVAASLMTDANDKAWSYTRLMIEPTQQQLPNELNAALETAVIAKTNNQEELARSHLDRAMSMARELGYL
jgi:eukaryotic-like serine/threonine-protein kinase